MKLRRRIPLLMFMFFIIACTRMPVQFIDIKNPHDRPLIEACVVIPKSAFHQTDNSLYPVIINSENQSILLSQIDDLDNNGVWDELALLVSLQTGETFTGRIKWVHREDYPEFTARTNVYLGKSRMRDGHFTEVREEVFPPDYECRTPYQYQFEGVGWENDRIAFRTYCDRRNGKDIFGKTIPDMILADIGKTDNYHERQSWGMDILKVGNSLGIGAVGAVKNGKIFRLADTRYHDFKIIAEGPVRSIFRLGFEGWIIDGDTLSANETITISAGRNGYSNTFEVTGKNIPDTLISGLSMIGIDGEPESIKIQDWSGISLSGLNDVDEHFLGMAVFTRKAEGFSAGITPKASDIYDVESPEYKAVKFHSKISDTYYLGTSGPAADFFVFTLWEGRYPDIHTSDLFRKAVQDEILSITHVPEVVLK